MSLRIFTLQLTGRIKPVEKIEAQIISLEKTYQSFLLAEQSPELAAFRELDSWVKSGAMQQAKREIEQQAFKGSPEFNQLKEFETLKKRKPVRDYFDTTESPDLRRFERLKESAELKEYYSLKDYVEGGAFQQDRKEIELQRFPGSSEDKHLTELTNLTKSKAFRDYLKLEGSDVIKKHQKFMETPVMRRYLELKNVSTQNQESQKELAKLKKEAALRAYFRFENSKELKHYHEVAGSHLPDRYRELIKLTNAPDFVKRVEYLKDKQKLRNSEAWKKLQQFKNLSASQDIRFFLKFEKSHRYINYLDTRDSFALQRYNELNKLTTSPEFLKRKAWLEDKRKWENTEEYKRFQTYSELQKHPQISLYTKYQGSREFDFLKSWQVTFNESFEGKTLDLSHWTPNSYWAEKLQAGNFSQPGDLQAYTGGKNCQVSGNRLKILVKKEKCRSKRWLPAAGFVQEEFEYTSDTLSTSKSFWQEGGIFEARILFNPDKQVVNSCYLQGEKNTSMLILVEQGPDPRMGILSVDGSGKPQFNGIHLNYLNKGKEYIFGIEWNPSSIVWKINHIPVFETGHHSISGSVHLNLTSLVIGDVPAGKLPSAFEIARIRCYRKVDVMGG
jgi:hypothetical protein